MQNLQNNVLLPYVQFVKSVCEHIAAIIVVSVSSSAVTLFVLPNFLNDANSVYWMLTAAVGGLIGCLLFLTYHFLFDRHEQKKWVQILSFVLIFLLSILISVAAVSFSRPGFPSSVSNGDVITPVIIRKADVILDCTEIQGWNKLTEEQRQSLEKLSRCALNVNYHGMKKYANISFFAHRMGTTRGIAPEWESDQAHQVINQEEVVDASKKCSDKIRRAKIVYTNIANEKIEQPFDYSFKILYFNGHNAMKDEWQAYFVDNPVESLDFSIRFPKGMPFPKSIRLMKTGSCYEEYTEQPKLSKSASPKDYVDEDKNEKVVTWHVENPSVKHTYKIMWDWE